MGTRGVRRKKGEEVEGPSDKWVEVKPKIPRPRYHHDMCLAVARIICKKGIGKSIPPMPITAVELSSITTGTVESPDIIAFHQNISNSSCIVFEIKLSRADFKADFSKECREAGIGMGVRRYYVVPTGLVSMYEELNGWGLVYFDGKNLELIKESRLYNETERQTFGETNTLINLIKRGVKWNSVFDNDDYNS
jgi:hypothetical protein|nr:MAG TPA: DNA repair protein MmcB-like protein [Caudoviricetes sp.]